MINYFLLVTENNTPIENVDEFIDTHNLEDIVELILTSPIGVAQFETYTVSMRAFEVEDEFLHFINNLVPIPGLVWISPYTEMSTSDEYVC